MTSPGNEKAGDGDSFKQLVSAAERCITDHNDHPLVPFVNKIIDTRKELFDDGIVNDYFEKDPVLENNYKVYKTLKNATLAVIEAMIKVKRLDFDYFGAKLHTLLEKAQLLGLKKLLDPLEAAIEVMKEHDEVRATGALSSLRKEYNDVQARVEEYFNMYSELMALMRAR